VYSSSNFHALLIGAREHLGLPAGARGTLGGDSPIASQVPRFSEHAFNHCGRIVPFPVDARMHEFLPCTRSGTMCGNDFSDDRSEFIDDLHNLPHTNGSAHPARRTATHPFRSEARKPRAPSLMIFIFPLYPRGCNHLESICASPHLDVMALNLVAGVDFPRQLPTATGRWLLLMFWPTAFLVAAFSWWFN
jgi:hypothetical protein